MYDAHTCDTVRRMPDIGDMTPEEHQSFLDAQRAEFDRDDAILAEAERRIRRSPGYASAASFDILDKLLTETRIEMHEIERRTTRSYWWMLLAALIGSMLGRIVYDNFLNDDGPVRREILCTTSVVDNDDGTRTIRSECE